MYRTFKRTCTNFEEFAKARKIHHRGNLTYEQAQEICRVYNGGRSPSQIKRGVKMEFERE